MPVCDVCTHYVHRASYWEKPTYFKTHAAYLAYYYPDTSSTEHQPRRNNRMTDTSANQEAARRNTQTQAQDIVNSAIGPNELFRPPSGLTRDQARSLSTNCYNTELFSPANNGYTNDSFVSFAALLGTNSLSVSRYLGMEISSRPTAEEFLKEWKDKKDADFPLVCYRRPKVVVSNSDPYIAKMEDYVYSNLPRTFAVLVQEFDPPLRNNRTRILVGGKVPGRDRCFEILSYKNEQGGVEKAFREDGLRREVLEVFYVGASDTMLRIARERLAQRKRI